MDIVNLLLQITGGVAGSVAVASALRPATLGKPGIALTGVVGGGLGIQAVNLSVGLPVAAAAARDLDAGTLVAQMAGACLGGAIVTLLVGLLTSQRKHKRPLEP